MNKRLLVLTGILSVLSVNVMGAPVNVGTDTITIGSMSSNNRFDGTTISSKQFWINDEFPDGSNERVIIKPGTLSMSNHNTSTVSYTHLTHPDTLRAASRQAAALMTVSYTHLCHEWRLVPRPSGA